MFIKFLAITIVLIIISLGSMQREAMADDNLTQYIEDYNNLCNIQLSNAINADLPHSTILFSIDNITSAQLSGNGLNIRIKSIHSTLDISLNSENSMVSMKYAL